MPANPVKVGEQITMLRKSKNLTQAELGERLGVSFQAVSKWERGETLPDTALLTDLANVLETTVDHILAGGERITRFTRRITIKQMREGIECFERMGELLGKDNLFYVGAMEGVDTKMNIELETYLVKSFTKEAMIAEATIQNIMHGAYVDVSDIQKGFHHEHWIKNVGDYAAKFGMK
jgi:transcriptional regulator with XRE-family HTH domain